MSPYAWGPLPCSRPTMVTSGLLARYSSTTTDTATGISSPTSTVVDTPPRNATTTNPKHRPPPPRDRDHQSHQPRRGPHADQRHQRQSEVSPPPVHVSTELAHVDQADH